MMSILNRLTTLLKSFTHRCRLNKRTDISRYEIFKLIPHQRVCSENVHADELFDLYQLGIFAAQQPSLFSTDNPQGMAQENLELVELQPKARYRPHYHEISIAVIYIIVGTGSFLLGEQTIDYSPGLRIVIPAGCMHGFNTNTRTLFLSIQSPPILNTQTGYVDLHY